MLNIYYVIDILTKYAWVQPLTEKKGKTVPIAFIKIVYLEKMG